MLSLLQFADLELDIGRYELRRNGNVVKLERIPMDLLIFLVDQRDRLITREEIIQRIWGKDVFLDTENAINTAIRKIRQALRDDPAEPCLLETVPGKGYRFIGEVTAVDRALAVRARPGESSSRVSPALPDAGLPVARAAPTRLHRWRPWAALSGALLAVLGTWLWFRRSVPPVSEASIDSIAVLPLENLTGDPAQEYFADGMTDALITDLAQIRSLRVISRTSIMRYKHTHKSLPEIAKELDVNGIVEGSVVRSGNRVRITSQLIRGPTDQHLWANSYEGDASDILRLQSEVSQAIAGQIRAVLTPEERTRLSGNHAVNSEAYELYLEGQYYWQQTTPQSTKKAIERFQQALQKDPNSALAYAGMADAYNMSSVIGAFSPEQSFPQAKAAATRALELDPALADAHIALGLEKAHYEFDRSGAEKEFLAAISLSPNSALAHRFYALSYLTPNGQHQQAIAEARKAAELDPLSPGILSSVALVYKYAGDYDQSVRQFQHALEINPNHGRTHLLFASLLADLDRYPESIAEFEKGEILMGTSPSKAASHAEALRSGFQAGGARSFWQQYVELGLKTMNEPDQYWFGETDIAKGYARLGNRDLAFKWLEVAYRERQGIPLSTLDCNAAFRSLRGDPRYDDLLKRLRLPKQSS
jgi:TolB-like protein/DNA-binding winged helix-turn-helix (wHTH) protein/Tfp pilus assembly protein PilF